MTTNIVDFCKKFGIPMTKVVLDVHNVEYPSEPMKSKKFRKFLSKINFEFEYSTDVHNVLEMMNESNKMVKSDSCSNYIRNKFYQHKHRLLKTLYEQKKFDSILESENLFNFIIDGYSFHQNKEWIVVSKKDITGTEVYSPAVIDSEFDEKQVIRTILNIKLCRHELLNATRTR